MKLYLYNDILFSEENLIDYLAESDSFLEEFKEYLDEMYGSIEICGTSFCASEILEELDPTLFNCAYDDYIDAQVDEFCVGSISCERDDFTDIRID